MKSSLSPKNGYAFGFRWSLVGCALALIYTTSCELIIPPDRSVPRYNTVHGTKKRPLLNPGGSGYSGNTSLAGRSNAIDYVYGQPRMAESAAPSTSAASAAPLPAAPAAAPIAESPKPAQTAAPRMASASEEKSFWDRMAFWRDDVSVKDVPKAARVRPVENQNIGSASAAAPVATGVAAGELAPLPGTADAAPISPTKPGEYPSLHSAPARPSVAAVDNSKQRAMAVRNELEADRATAMQSREQLVKDAAAEPSLLANPPKLAAPAGALPPPPPMNAAQAKAVQEVASQPAAAPVQTAAPVSPINNGSSAFERLTQRPLTAPMTASQAAPQVATAPAAAPALEPIRLTPPASEPASPAAGTPFASVNVSAPPAVSGMAAPASNAAPALEPIRLTPPSAMANSAAASGTQTANLEPIRLKPPAGAVGGTSGGLPSTQAITEEGLQTGSASSTHQPYTPSYLPQSRYAERRR